MSHGSHLEGWEVRTRTCPFLYPQGACLHFDLCTNVVGTFEEKQLLMARLLLQQNLLFKGAELASPFSTALFESRGEVTCIVVLQNKVGMQVQAARHII